MGRHCWSGWSLYCLIECANKLKQKIIQKDATFKVHMTE